VRERDRDQTATTSDRCRGAQDGCTPAKQRKNVPMNSANSALGFVMQKMYHETA
jgi:hypothetical protein